MEHTLDYKNRPKYQTYRNRHNKLNVGGDMLSKKQFDDISVKNCTYCGTTGPNGIDRIDSSIGYILNNCTPCCKHCNYVKGNLSMELFNTWADRFTSFRYSEKAKD